MDDERIRLILDLAQSSKDAADFKEKIENLDDSFKKAGKSTDDFEQKTTKATKSTKEAAKAAAEMQRGVLSLSQAFQDWAQGGFAAVLNNIPQIVMQFGGSAGLAGAIGAVGVACLVAKPAFNALVGAFTGSNAIPETTDALQRMQEALKEATTKLKEMREQGTLSNAQLVEYNRLTAESARLEKEANAEKERRNALDKIRREESDGNPESIGVVKAAIGEQGGVDATIQKASEELYGRSRNGGDIGDIVGKMDDIAKREGADRAAGKTGIEVRGASGIPTNVPIDEYYGRQMEPLKKAFDDAVKEIARNATDIVGKSALGDQGAIRKLDNLIPGGSFGQATPEAIRAQDAEVQAAQDQGDRLHRGNARRNTGNRMAGDLTVQGGRIQAEDEQARREASAKEAKDQAEAINDQQDAAAKADGRDMTARQREARSRFQSDAQAARAAPQRRAANQRAALGDEFGERARNFENFDPTAAQQAAAGKAIQGMMAQGATKDQAMIMAFNQIVQNQMKLAQQAGVLLQRAQGVGQTLNTPMPRGN